MRKTEGSGVLFQHPTPNTQPIPSCTYPTKKKNPHPSSQRGGRRNDNTYEKNQIFHKNPGTFHKSYYRSWCSPIVLINVPSKTVISCSNPRTYNHYQIKNRNRGCRQRKWWNRGEWVSIPVLTSTPTTRMETQGICVVVPSMHETKRGQTSKDEFKSYLLQYQEKINMPRRDSFNCTRTSNP